jgi:hypothetical protein
LSGVCNVLQCNAKQYSQWRHVGVPRWEVDVKHKQAALVWCVLRAADDAAHLRHTKAGKMILEINDPNSGQKPHQHNVLKAKAVTITPTESKKLQPTLSGRSASCRTKQAAAAATGRRVVPPRSRSSRPKRRSFWLASPAYAEKIPTKSR